MIEEIMAEALKSQESVYNLLKNKKVIEDLERKIDYNYSYIKTPIDSDSFGRTQRKRNFFYLN
jgi:hypothetical protein